MTATTITSNEVTKVRATSTVSLLTRKTQAGSGVQRTRRRTPSARKLTIPIAEPVIPCCSAASTIIPPIR